MVVEVQSIDPTRRNATGCNPRGRFLVDSFALSGQQYSAPAKKLSFDPRPGAARRLPWLIPGANGLLERQAGGGYRLTVLSGTLAVDELWVANALPARNVALQGGESIDLRAVTRKRRARNGEALYND